MRERERKCRALSFRSFSIWFTIKSWHFYDKAYERKYMNSNHKGKDKLFSLCRFVCGRNRRYFQSSRDLLNHHHHCNHCRSNHRLKTFFCFFFGVSYLLFFCSWAVSVSFLFPFRFWLFMIIVSLLRPRNTCHRCNMWCVRDMRQSFKSGIHKLHTIFILVTIIRS